MKYDWRKQEKELYGPRGEAVVVEVPKQKFIMISGKGDPNQEAFSERVGALYALAYSIKMRYKAEHKEAGQDEMEEFAVYPLEGVWDMDDEAAFRTCEEGLCVQILHTGLFDDEPESFEKMDLFLKENQLERKGHTHREIYLKDMSRTSPEKMKTILRYRVCEKQ